MTKKRLPRQTVVPVIRHINKACYLILHIGIPLLEPLQKSRILRTLRYAKHAGKEMGVIVSPLCLHSRASGSFAKSFNIVTAD